jgi:hypothetical protein
MNHSVFDPMTTDAPLRGMTKVGNIDLANRPLVKLGNGEIGTIRSMGINVDGRETLIPTIYDGKAHTSKEAIDRFYKTGKHLGVFDTPENASQAGRYLSEQQGRDYGLDKFKLDSYFDQIMRSK